jgi:hypothetical protein
VANEIAGERIVEATLQKLVAAGRIYDYKLNKRVADHNGQTWGHHENYTVRAGSLSINKAKLALLGIHLATRNIWAGAGGLQKTIKVPTFYVAQKAIGLGCDFSPNTTSFNKPVVNLRNEPLADPEKWARVHVTSGDANMSPWSIWMSLGTTSIVLRLIENGVDLPGLRTGTNLVSVSNQVAEDHTLKRTIELQSGRRVKPIHIQVALVETALKLQEAGIFTLEEKAVLAQWQQVLDDLEADPNLALDRVEWLNRKHLLANCQGSKAGKPLIQKLCDVDMLCDEISERSIGLRLRNGAWQPWMPAETEIVRAVTEPPGHDTGQFAR